MSAATLDTALHWLLRTTLEASVLILAVLGLRAMLGTRLGPAWRLGLWLLVGAKLLLPACIPAGFGLGVWGQDVASAAFVSSPAMETASMDLLPQAIQASASVASPMAQAWGQTQAVEPSTLSILPLLGFLWLMGAFSILSLAVWKHRRFQQQLRAAPPVQDPALLSTLRAMQKLVGVSRPVIARLLSPGATPAITGLRRPCLLLPADWVSRFDEAGLRHVMLHELLHVRHRDLAWNWATLVVQALHWFNPLVWTIGSRFQADRELRCDAAVMDLLSPNERLSYGHTLLRIQETFLPPPAMAGLAPCVRHHPTLLQRITMIARPNRNHPGLQALFTLAFGLITCYAFTTVAAADGNPIPAKDRSREGQRGGPPAEKGDGTRRDLDGKMREGMPREPDGKNKEGAPRERDGKMKEGSRDGDRPRTGERDGDKPRTGPRDGERPRTGERDGDKPRTGSRDGDRPRTGERDGDKPRTGARDGDRPRTGERDGDKPRTGARDGERDRDGGEKKANMNTSAETLTFRVTKNGDSVMLGSEEVPMNRLRGRLQSYLPEHTGASVVIVGDSGVPHKALAEAMDAVRDNGNKNVRIAAD